MGLCIRSPKGGMFYACNAQGGRAAMRYSIDAPLAMAYVPMQVWRNLYSARDALAQGTLFSELNLPFLGREGLRSVC